MEILALLSGPLGWVAGAVAALFVFLGAILNAKRKGRQEGRAQAAQEARDHVERSAAQQAQIDQSTARLGGDAARDQLRKKYGRP